MGLPKLDVPKFKVKVPGIKKEVTARPFLVKEGNILTQASESDTESQFLAVEQVVANCTFGELDVKSLEMYQLQSLFLKIKGKSSGSTQEFILNCGNCNNKMNYTMDLDDFEVLGATDQYTIDLKINDSAGIIFKRPTAEVLLTANKLTDLEIFANCIKYVYDTEEKTAPEDLDAEELKEFIEQLPISILNDATEFVASTPVLGKSVDFTCNKCEHKNVVVINGVEHFFG